MTLRLATCAYPIERLESFEQFREKQERWVREASEAGAQVLVFPEYASMELGGLGAEHAARDLAEELRELQQLLPSILATYRELANRHGVVVLAPSFPERVSEEASEARYHNRARLFGPRGGEGLCEKVMMTRFEQELWHIDAGSLQQVFRFGPATLGVAICYDSEFPLLVRRQVDAGANLLLVPSCTDTVAGYHRVQLSCRARALENQCFVAQSVTVGSAPWSLTVDENVGAAGVFGPVDRGFPGDGVIALGQLNEPGWVFADLDLQRLAEVRRDGQVKNHQDWHLPGHLKGTVGSVDLK